MQQYRNGKVFETLMADMNLGQTVFSEAIGSVDGVQL